MNSPILIQRLGFDSYASNLIVNLIENGLMYDGYRNETEDTSVRVNLIDNRFMVAVRCYVPSIGWQTVEIFV